MGRTLILGSGFGGIAVATELRRALGDRHEVVLVDRNERFVMGLRKLWELVGIGAIDEGSRSRRRLADSGIRFVQAEITAIDAAARRVATSEGSFEADDLVIALGAVGRPDLVPGLAEHAHDVWDRASVPAAREAISRFTSGRIAVVICGAPYPCPPAPYECVMLLDEHFRARGLRDRVDLSIATVQPMLLPNAGREGSAWLAGQLASRGIGHRAGIKVERVAPGRVELGDGEVPFDLLIGIPPHRAPEVVKAAGLTGPGEWIEVDPGSLETRAPHVFAIGDVTQIKLANGLPFPKAGLMAELEGVRVARAIAARVEGTAAPAPFDGRAFCFVEMGGGVATRIEGDFFATPEPRVKVVDVSASHFADKRRFESDRLASWFGR